MMDNKKKERHVVYEKIFDKCRTYVMKYAENDKYRCFYEVPEFILGLPVYNINSAIMYILDKLKDTGFLVKYFFPKHLYISWDLQEIAGKKPQPFIPNIYTPPKLQPLPKLSITNNNIAFPPPPVATRTPVNNNIIMPHIPTFDLPLPQSSTNNNNNTDRNSKFIKSISSYKPSGKFTLNI
jgi:hypothetical protein